MLSVARIRKRGKTQSQDPFDKYRIGPAQVEGDRHAFPVKDAEDENAGSQLGKHRGHRGPCDIHMENKDKQRVQYNVQDGADERRHHA